MSVRLTSCTASHSIMFRPKSLYISHAVSHYYYGTEYEIWVGFGSVGAPKIANWAVKYATFEGIFLCFHGQNIVVFTLKS